MQVKISSKCNIFDMYTKFWVLIVHAKAEETMIY